LKGAEESLKITRNIAMELHLESLKVEEYLLKNGFKVKVIGNTLYARKIEG
jgi:hypothetical protein